MLADIIAIGDELLIGQTIDTNSGWLAEQMNLIGVEVHEISSISDDHDHILSSIENSFSKVDLILLTGGLGPTRDDKTKEVLCEYFGSELVMNEEILSDITRRFKNAGLEMLEVNQQQAALPSNCQILPNTRGTASGMWFEKDGKILISMPGVPYEMKGIMREFGLPRIREFFNTPSIVHHTIHTQGIGESILADIVSNWEDKAQEQGVGVAYLPSPGMVRVRLTARGENRDELSSKINSLADEFGRLAPEYVFGVNGDSLEKIIGDILRTNGQSLSTAESCTGGNIARMITSIPGSSDYFEGTVVSYSNEVKRKVLGVNEDSLNDFGAVSREVVEEMALGVQKLLSTDWAIATSGVAGPEGGSDEKPVGTVWMGLASPSGVKSRRYKFGRSRNRNITMSSLSALNWLRVEMLNSLFAK